MKRVKGKGIPVTVYQPVLEADHFYGSEVITDLGTLRREPFPSRKRSKEDVVPASYLAG